MSDLSPALLPMPFLAKGMGFFLFEKIDSSLLTRILVNAILMMTKIVVKTTQILVTKGDCNMPLGNRLKELRAAKGLNQQGLGSLVGASRQTISLIERGDYNPSITLALRIAKVFGTTVDEVFYLTEEDEEQ